MRKPLDRKRLVVRPMILDDLDEVMDIERLSFLSPWTPDLFVNEFSNPRSVKRIVQDRDSDRLLAYMVYWVVLDEAHLMNIAVRPSLKGRGIGSLLMEKMVEECRERRCKHVSLEVRENNFPAIDLYLRSGFRPVGRRANYYLDEGKDAILMDLDLTYENE